MRERCGSSLLQALCRTVYRTETHEQDGADTLREEARGADPPGAATGTLGLLPVFSAPSSWLSRIANVSSTGEPHHSQPASRSQSQESMQLTQSEILLRKKSPTPFLHFHTKFSL